jgi:hypothetical protein
MGNTANNTLPGGFTHTGKVFKTVAASRTVARSDFGHILYSTAESVVLTLPVAATCPGAVVHFVSGVPSASAGARLTPDSADNIYGNALTATDGQSLINTHTTDVGGDSASVISDGLNWLILNVTGTWAKG